MRFFDLSSVEYVRAGQDNLRKSPGYGFYFSFITLTTVGYGDITPVSRAARWLAVMEAMTGSLYVAVLIARLVSLYSNSKSHEHRESESKSPSSRR